MSTGFGIAALVCAILAIFIPFGIVLSGIAIVLAVIAALAGDKTFAIATTVIALVNTIFLSPTTWIMLGGGDQSAKNFYTTLIVVGCLLPVGAILLHRTGKASIGR